MNSVSEFLEPCIGVTSQVSCTGGQAKGLCHRKRLSNAATQGFATACFGRTLYDPLSHLLAHFRSTHRLGHHPDVQATEVRGGSRLGHAAPECTRLFGGDRSEAAQALAAKAVCTALRALCGSPLACTCSSCFVSSRAATVRALGSQHKADGFSPGCIHGDDLTRSTSLLQPHGASTADAPEREVWKPRGLESASSWLCSGLGLPLGSRPFSREDGSGDGIAPDECRRPSSSPTSSLLVALFTRTCRSPQLLGRWAEQSHEPLAAQPHLDMALREHGDNDGGHRHWQCSCTAR